MEIYWLIGHRIRTEALGNERATYGEQIVSTLSRQLEADYGHGLSAKKLRHILRFAEAIPSEEIVSAARRQLSWTHIKILIHKCAGREAGALPACSGRQSPNCVSLEPRIAPGAVTSVIVRPPLGNAGWRRHPVTRDTASTAWQAQAHLQPPQGAGLQVQAAAVQPGQVGDDGEAQARARHGLVGAHAAL